MAQLGSVEYVFSVQDDGTPVIKRIEGQMKTSLANIANASRKSTSESSTGWEQLKGTMSGAGSSITGSIKNMVAGFVSLYTAYRGVKEVFAFIKEGVQSAATEEAVYTRLQTALKNYGYEYKAVGKDLYDYANALQYQLGVQDTAIMSGMSYLATLGQAPAVIKKATQAAVDLAATGHPVEEAFDAMGKALMGRTRGLLSFGISVDKAQIQEKGWLAIEEKMAAVHAQALAQSTTYEGSLARISGQYGELKESVGYAIINSDGFRAALVATAEQLNGLGGALDANKAGVSDWITNAIGKAITAADALARAMAACGMIISAQKEVLYTIAEAFGWLGEQIGWAAEKMGSLLSISGIESWGRSMQFAGVDMQQDAQREIATTTEEMADQFLTLTQGSKAVQSFGDSYEKAAETVKNSRGVMAGPSSKIAVAPELGGAGGGAGKKPKEPKWEPPTEVGEFFDMMRKLEAEMSNSSDWKMQETATKRMSEMDKKFQQMSTQPDWFYGGMAEMQRQYTSPRSTFKEQEEAFKRLQDMYKQAQTMMGTFDQQAAAGWEAFGAGAKNAGDHMNTFLQSMSTLGQQSFELLGGAFTDSFTALMKGDIGSLKTIWWDFLKNLLNTFINTIAQMISQWLVMKLLTGLFGAGFGAASGGVTSGEFLPATGGMVSGYASGGIVSAPTFGVIGEGSRPEAIVPLPDGRSIPVQMQKQKEKPIELTIINTIDPVDVVQRAGAKNPNVIINPVVSDYHGRGAIQKIILRGGK